MTVKTIIPNSAKQFLAIAHHDLKAARFLYQEGCYPQAVFYLEQSVEKGLKSYSIALGIIDEKAAWHEISHKTLRIYEKSTKNFRQRVADIQENLKKIPQLETFFQQYVNFIAILEQLDDTLDQIKPLSKQDEKSLHLTKEELKIKIASLQKLNRDMKRETVKTQSKPLPRSEFHKSKQFIIKLLMSALADQPERLLQAKEELKRNFTFESYEKITKDAISQYIPPVEIFQSFFQLSIILQPHAIARYPNANFNPMVFYTPDLPLIESFLKLADITDRGLKQIDDIYQKSEEVQYS
jgi:hypothetical protein